MIKRGVLLSLTKGLGEGPGIHDFGKQQQNGGHPKPGRNHYRDGALPEPNKCLIERTQNANSGHYPELQFGKWVVIEINISK